MDEISKPTGISFIIPAYNEEDAIATTIQQIHELLVELDREFEIIVVDDGSADNTADRAQDSGLAKILSHSSNAGYGHSLKTGIKSAEYPWIGIIDADGTYPVKEIENLIRAMDNGSDMAIAKRNNIHEIDGAVKRAFRKTMIWFVNTMINAKIEDPNSGLRIFRKDLALKFFPFLCNTFSFTTSLTIFTIGEGYFTTYVPSNYEIRIGETKVHHFRDSIRMIQLILQGITFFNPMKFFLLLAFLHLTFVSAPALAFFEFGFTRLATVLLVFGTLAPVLAGLGMMTDIMRISQQYDFGNSQD